MGYGYYWLSSLTVQMGKEIFGHSQVPWACIIICQTAELFLLFNVGRQCGPSPGSPALQPPHDQDLNSLQHQTS